MLLPVLLALMLAANACSSGDFVDPRMLTASEISGFYSSESAVGVLGNIQMELVRLEESRVYAARLTGEDEARFGIAEGIGTLADNHIVLHFDRGEAYDYYFEGDVLSGDSSIGISGEFIFPDQHDQLPVTFSQIAPAGL